MRVAGGKVLGGLAGYVHRTVQRRYSKEAVKRHDGERAGRVWRSVRKGGAPRLPAAPGLSWDKCRLGISNRPTFSDTCPEELYGGWKSADVLLSESDNGVKRVVGRSARRWQAWLLGGRHSPHVQRGL